MTTLLILLVGILIVLFYIIHLHWKLDIALIDRDYYKTLLKIEEDYGKKVEASRDRCLEGWTQTLACAKGKGVPNA